MKQIPNKNNSIFKRFMRKLCWLLHDLMKWIIENMLCNYAVDIQSIKEKVQDTQNKADKFEIIEEVVPEIQRKLDELNTVKLNLMMIQDDFTELVNDINLLYVADKDNNIVIKNIIFDKLKNDGYINEKFQIQE